MSGSHVYAEEGSFSVSVIVTDADTPNNAATAVTAARVADAALAASGSTVRATEGSPTGSVTVATFTDADPAGTAADYTATIDWGDSTTSTGTVTGTGTFSVTGSHTYAEEGSYTAAVSISDVGGSTASARTSVSVGDAALAASGVSLNSTNPVSAVVANFSDADPAGTATDYTATIDWGDASSSPGTIGGTGPFTVSGSHTYSALGPYTVKTHICDIGGSCADATSTILVYAFPAGGDFVVGDKTSAGPVTYWGAQWAKVNSLSGGAAPDSFKEFENSQSASACGAPWMSDPGNSSVPPGSVPTYMGVIVSSLVSQAGSTISGNTLHIVVVKTDPGYGPNPGHAGTGTVVAVVC